MSDRQIPQKREVKRSGKVLQRQHTWANKLVKGSKNPWLLGTCKFKPQGATTELTEIRTASATFAEGGSGVRRLSDLLV